MMNPTQLETISVHGRCVLVSKLKVLYETVRIIWHLVSLR